MTPTLTSPAYALRSATMSIDGVIKTFDFGVLPVIRNIEMTVDFGQILGGPAPSPGQPSPTVKAVLFRSSSGLGFGLDCYHSWGIYQPRGIPWAIYFENRDGAALIPIGLGTLSQVHESTDHRNWDPENSPKYDPGLFDAINQAHIAVAAGWWDLRGVS